MTPGLRFHFQAALDLYTDPAMAWLVDRLEAALGRKDLFIRRCATAQARMSGRSSGWQRHRNGTTERDHLIAVQRATGKTPPELVFPPIPREPRPCC